MQSSYITHEGIADASDTFPSLYPGSIAVNPKCGPNCPECCPRCGQGHPAGVSCPACRPESLAGLLESLTANAHSELGTAPTPFDLFLDGLVADAADDLAYNAPTFPYRPDGPVYHVRQAVAGYDADMADRIRGVAESENMSGSLKGEATLNATRHKLTHAVRSPDMTCTSPAAWSESILPDGAVKIRHQPCGSCDRCLAWRRREIALRFIYAAGDAQCTMIRVSGWGMNEWDKAAAWLDAMGRRQSGQRWRGLQPAEDYTPTATMIYTCEVPAALIDLVRKDTNRKGLSVNVRCESIDIGKFGGLLDTMKTRTGNVLNKETRQYVRHCTSRFVAWPDYEDDLPDYVNGDTTMHPLDGGVDLPAETPATEVETTLRRIKDDEWRAELAAYIRMGRVGYIDIGLFLNLPNEPDPDGEVMQTIKRREYGGSSQLLIDAARHYVGDAPYRAAYCAVYERVFGDDWTYATL